MAQAKPITSADVREYETHRFSAEASELGWPPGEVPREIPTSLGNKQPFFAHSITPEKFVYRQSCGCIELTVYND